MRPLIHHTIAVRCRSGATPRQLRRQTAHLRRDLDRYEQAFSSWMQRRPLRERQAEARFHVVEAQLARLTGSDTIRASRADPVAPSVSPAPVLLPIAAYRL